jgi:hypothetical protein
VKRFADEMFPAMYGRFPDDLCRRLGDVTAGVAAGEQRPMPPATVMETSRGISVAGGDCGARGSPYHLVTLDSIDRHPSSRRSVQQPSRIR